jgi:hypothetical protein
VRIEEKEVTAVRWEEPELNKNLKGVLEHILSHFVIS